MAIVDNGIFIRNAVLNHDVSDETIKKIKSLVSDKNPMPITHAPIGTIALAALDVLGVQPYKGDNQFVHYYKEMFSSYE